MVVSTYFTDNELETQLRLQFSEEEQWDIDFKVFFNHIEELEDYFYLKLRGREFRIDKVTGIVTDMNNTEEEEEVL